MQVLCKLKLFPKKAPPPTLTGLTHRFSSGLSANIKEILVFFCAGWVLKKEFFGVWDATNLPRDFALLHYEFTPWLLMISARLIRFRFFSSFSLSRYATRSACVTVESVIEVCRGWKNKKIAFKNCKSWKWVLELKCRNFVLNGKYTTINQIKNFYIVDYLLK